MKDVILKTLPYMETTTPSLSTVTDVCSTSTCSQTTTLSPVRALHRLLGRVMDPLYLLVALLCSPSTLAMPIPAPLVSVSGPSPLAVVLGVCTPFIALAVAKYAYMKYRRIESIHSEPPHTPTETEIKSSPVLVGLGLERTVPNKPSRKLTLDYLSGYAVGMLGSPEWETRVKVRVDRAMRKARSLRYSETTSRAFSPSTATRSRFESSHRSRGTSTGGYRSSRQMSSSASSRSRTMSLSFLEMYSPDSNIINCGSVHPSSPSCCDKYPQLPPLGESVHPKAGGFRGKTSSAPLSPTLMQMIEPEVTSWQEDVSKKRSVSSLGTGKRSGTHSPSMSCFPTVPSCTDVRSG